MKTRRWLQHVFWWVFTVLATLVFALLAFSMWENPVRQPWWLRLACLVTYVSGWILLTRFGKPRSTD